jgi:hypothetical protein
MNVVEEGVKIVFTSDPKTWTSYLKKMVLR